MINVIGARPMSMGGSFIALADDANAIFFNSAGLAQLKNISGIINWKINDRDKFSSIETAYINSTNRKVGILGTGYIHSKTKNEEIEYNLDMIIVPVLVWEVAKMPYSINLKYIKEKTSGENSFEGMSIDLNFILLQVSPLNFGVSLRNLTKPDSPNFTEEKNFGISLKLSKLNLAVDYRTRGEFEWNEDFVSMGVEFYSEESNLAAGTYIDEQTKRRNYTFGIGFRALDYLKIDYCYIKDTSTAKENVHLISAGYVYK
jgi:hypothetical protein